jgi:hypothetical protein
VYLPWEYPDAHSNNSFGVSLRFYRAPSTLVELLSSEKDADNASRLGSTPSLRVTSLRPTFRITTGFDSVPVPPRGQLRPALTPREKRRTLWTEHWLRIRYSALLIDRRLTAVAPTPGVAIRVRCDQRGRRGCWGANDSGQLGNGNNDQ